MASRVWRVVAVAVLAATGLLWSGKPASAQEAAILVATGEFTTDVSDAYTDGTHVAWIYGADTPSVSCNTLNAAPLVNPDDVTSVTISRGATFAVSDGVLIWEHLVQECQTYTPIADPGVYGIDLDSGEDLVVTTDPTREVRMVDGTVVWSVADGSANVSAIRMDGIEGGSPETVVEFDPPIEARQLRFDGERVAWMDEEEGQLRVMSVVPGDEPEELLRSPSILWFDVNSDWLVWQDGTTLRARDLTTGAEQTLSEQASSSFSTDGRYVLWAGASDDGQVTLWAYDLQTASRFNIVNYIRPTETENLGIRSSSIRGGALAWDVFGYPSIGTQIWGAYLVDVLPTSPRPDPGATDPNWNWYPETGHYLAFGFRDYWQANGGLPVFGYPLTEEFIERNADTGEEYTVQYLERQRFEWHPENDGTPYEVLLGRLGAEQAMELGMTGTEPFLPEPMTGGETPGCAYFPETSHYACDPFLSYWQTHGLEFGDPGVSFQESLALFGYPISEPFTTTNPDGDTVLTQYFERAVFEYHPDNPEPYQVLLRRLGAEVLETRGWS